MKDVDQRERVARGERLAALQRLRRTAGAIAEAFGGSLIAADGGMCAVAWGRGGLSHSDPEDARAAWVQIKRFALPGEPLVGCLDQEALSKHGDLGSAAQRRRQASAAAAFASTTEPTPQLLVSEAAGLRYGIFAPDVGARVVGAGRNAWYRIAQLDPQPHAPAHPALRHMLTMLQAAARKAFASDDAAPCVLLGAPGSGKALLLDSLERSARADDSQAHEIVRIDLAAALRCGSRALEVVTKTIALEATRVVADCERTDGYRALLAFPQEQERTAIAGHKRALKALVFGDPPKRGLPLLAGKPLRPDAKIADALGAVAARRRIIVAIEGLANGPPDVSAFVANLCSRLARVKNVAVVIAAESQAGLPSDLADAADVVSMRPLDEQATAALIAAAVPGRPLPSEVADAIANMSGGMPVAMLDVCRSVAARTPRGASLDLAALDEALPLPSVVAALDQLGDLAPLAQIVAHFEGAFTCGAAADLCAMEPAATEPLLEALIARGVLVCDRSTGRDMFTFATSALREHARLAVPSAKRRRLKNAIAEIASRGCPIASHEPHWVAADLEAGARHDEAADWWAHAAYKFVQDRRSTEAIEAFTRALPLLKKCGRDDQDEVEAQWRLARCEQQGRLSGRGSRSLLSEATRVRRALEVSPAGHHATRMRALVCEHESARILGLGARARKAVEALHAMAGDGPLDTFAKAKTTSIDALDSGKLRQSIAALSPSVDADLAAELAGDYAPEAARFWQRQSLLARSYAAATRALTAPDADIDEAGLVAEAEALDDPTNTILVFGLLAQRAFWRDDPTLTSFALAASAISQRQGNHSAVALCNMLIASVQLNVDRMRAVRGIRSAVEAYAEHAPRASLAFAHYLCARAEFQFGQRSRAADQIEKALIGSKRYGSAPFVAEYERLAAEIKWSDARSGTARRGALRILERAMRRAQAQGNKLTLDRIKASKIWSTRQR
ncbi:MAG: hypothetical protein AAFQ45_01930 [Pseudomonadota bacterium]